MLGWFLYFITRSPNGSSKLTLFIDNSSYRIIPLMSPCLYPSPYTHTHTQTHTDTDTQTHRHRHTDTDTQTHRKYAPQLCNIEPSNLSSLCNIKFIKNVTLPQVFSCIMLVQFIYLVSP